MSLPIACTSLVRIAIVLAVFAILPAAAQPTAVTVNLDAPRQTLDGFGATMKPLVYGGVDYLSPSERTAALAATISDVGLSMGALEITTEGESNDNADPFTAAAFDFSNFQAGIDAIVTPGEPLGLVGWHPGARINLLERQSWMTGLRGADYGNYLDEIAEHFLQQMIWWRNTYGEVPSLIQLFNEPMNELDNPAPGIYDKAQEIVDIVKAVGARLRGAGFNDVLFIVANDERVDQELVVAQALYDDPVARQYVGAIAYHPYPYLSSYSSPAKILAESGAGNPDATSLSERAQLKAIAADFSTALGREVPLWMTEVSEGPANNTFGFGSIDELRARAIHIHDEILYTGASAFFGMLMLWDQQSHWEHFGNCETRNEESMIVLIDNMDCRGDGDTGEITINPIGYAMGHYARWADPGSVVVETSSTNSRVQVTGLHDVANDRVALVLINNTSNEAPIEVALTGGSIAGEVTGEASYEDVRWGPAPHVNSANDRLSLTLPAESVVTLEIPLGTVTSGSSSLAPSSPTLRPPFPNPTSGTATVPFSLERSGHVRLEIVDVLGRIAAVLVNGVRPAGAYLDRLPAGLRSGHYTLRLQTPDGISTAPLTVTR